MFRKFLVTGAAAAALALVAVMATAQQAITFTTAAVGTSGVTGSGSIAPGSVASESTLNAQWQGLVPGSHHFVSQYHGTSCATYDAAPEFVFTEVMADTQGKAAALITVKKPFVNWPNRPHFLILHATGAPTSAAIACGMIVAQAAAATAPSSPATAAPAPASPAAPSAGTGDVHAAHANDSTRFLVSGLGVLVLLVAAGLGGYRVMRRG